MPNLGMKLSDVIIVRQYLDEIEAISMKYNSNRDEVIAFADRVDQISVKADIA